MKLRLLTAALVLATPLAALAQDKSVLNDKDDIDFAKALVANGYPDLAERLLGVVEKSGKAGDQAKAAIAAIKLDVAQDAASKIEDPIKRKEALVKVLADKEKFIEEFKGKDAAEDVRNALPDLYNLIGETLSSAIKKEKDEKVLEALRSEGDALFSKAEQAMKNRIAEIRAIETKAEADESKLMAARYNFSRTMYFHALLFPPKSAKRISLCNDALNEYGEFELDYGGDNPPDLLFYAYIDMGLCTKETGSLDEAIKLFEKTINLREGFGPKNEKGLWPIPPAQGVVVDMACYGIHQKMVVLRDQKKFDEVVKVGKDYFSSIAKPFSAASSMHVANELGEAQIATGDLKGAAATAKSMIDEDPNGLGGFLGRALIEKMGGAVGTPYTDKLKTAATKIGANDIDRGIAVARQVLSDTAGTADEQEAGCAVWMLIGYAYSKRGWVDEAALAYETAVIRYPKAKDAPEALTDAIQCYTIAKGKSQRKYYRERIDAATSRLLAEYASSPFAAGIQMRKAEALDSDGDYVGAIELYKKIEKSSTDFTKARVKIGIPSFNQMLKVGKEAEEAEKAGKADEAKAKREEKKKWYADTEAALKDAVTVIQGHPETMDPKVLSAYDEQEYYATLSLAKLYMIEDAGRAADAGPMIDRLEAKWGKDGKKGPEIQNLRGRLFLSQGKIDEAAKWVDDLVKRDPKAAAGPAGQLARALDTMGAEKFKTAPDSLEGDQLWTRAARYYWISIEPQVTGAVSQNATEMTELGDRLYVYGLHFNGVPESRNTFTDWVPGTKRAPDFWVKAARVYEAALAQNPAYRMTIKLGRTYGYLTKWNEASGIYAKLFDQEQIVDQKDKRKLDRTIMSAKGDLVMAYVEWGVAERMAAQGPPPDKDRLTRAMAIFTVLCNTLKPETMAEAYWAAHYQLVRTLIDRGEYKNAQLSIEDILRSVSATYDDGKYGYKKLFEEALDELKKK